MRSLVFVYTVLYVFLIGHRLSRLVQGSAPLPEGGGITTLQGVAALFSDKAIVFAGWTHYIAFDLFLSGFIVEDAQRVGIPHSHIVWTVPCTLMAGPAGLASYLITKEILVRTRGTRSEQKLDLLSSYAEQLTAAFAESTVQCRVSTLLYCGVTALGLFMVGWVLVFPSSW